MSEKDNIIGQPQSDPTSDGHYNPNVSKEPANDVLEVKNPGSTHFADYSQEESLNDTDSGDVKRNESSVDKAGPGDRNMPEDERLTEND